MSPLLTLKVRAILGSKCSEAEVAAIIEAVPYLTDPRALVQSLANLQRWFPSQDPVEVGMGFRALI